MPMKIGKTWVPLTNLRGHENRISSIGLFHIGIAYGSTAWRKHEIVYKLSKVSLTKRVKKEIDDYSHDTETWFKICSAPYEKNLSLMYCYDNQVMTKVEDNDQQKPLCLTIRMQRANGGVVDLYL